MKDMWKDYSIGFIKRIGFQRIRSHLCVYFCSVSFFTVRLFYNFWNYEIESVVLEEGNWQGTH